MQNGQRVMIKDNTGGMRDFVGRKGTVINAREYQDGRTWLHRVELDDVVYIDGVGHVKDDLWSSAFLKKI